MGYSMEQLLQQLKELQIDYNRYDHPVVLTVEAQAKHVGNNKGALSKNLFLKDKKNRFYIVSAMADTKVDLKVLSQRLGLGKTGLRMAPEEALPEILQVPLGSVTPFALVNESARHVSLLLDKGFKDQDLCIFHPLSNDVSIALTANDLVKFFKSIGKDPAYVDLEANPPVGKDQPPDLASLVPSDAVVLLTSPSEKSEANPIPLNDKSAPAPVKGKSSSVAQKEKSGKGNLEKAKPTTTTYADSKRFVEEVLEKINVEIERNGKENGALTTYNLRLELETLATSFKNMAYTEGFHAASSATKQRSFGCL
ncbi:prolyl-tRNA synthetase associated domain-containing protein 1 [Impatiens glandulifera]|uniref:prolyl-tRNA synthetase associated domain-containing protein 1 n=1 Tax=Impatiens glandulifera TaxID=253017 RepID=UPI001FB119BE|nr:prolyl-tRNA synthetase associated domain-containing protein 1 [Impatiens glandulifera]